MHDLRVIHALNSTIMSKIHYIVKPPKDVYLAYSGGVDSVVMLHSLLRRKHNVTLLFVDHANEFSKHELSLLLSTAAHHNLPYVVFQIPPFDKSTSLEAFWSEHRNRIYQSMDKPVVVCHHLDDSLEWYLMSTFQGTTKIMDPVNRNVLRPMLTTTKKTILEYANKYNLTYLTDPTNLDPDFNLRNKVRLQLVENVKACFPGIYTTVRRLVVQKHNRTKELPVQI